MADGDRREVVESDDHFDPVNGVALRWALIAFGFVNVAIGVIGVVVPGLPTTVFLLIAVWAFSRSSRRFQAWLLHHPRLGPLVRDWRRHKVIPRRAKILAAAMMTMSFAYVWMFVATDWVLPAVLAGVMVPALVYIWTRAAEPPNEEDLS